MANYHIRIYTYQPTTNDSSDTFVVNEGVLNLNGSKLKKDVSNRFLDLQVLNGKSSQSSKLKIDKKEITVSVATLDYRKELYKPGWVRLKLQFTTTETITVKEIKSLFSSCVLDLEEETQTAQPFMVAKNYFIFQVKPEFKSVEGKTTLYVTLMAYSPDKFLTLDKYSRTYTCKRFFEEQLAETLNDYQAKNSFNCFINLTESAQRNLHHLGVTVTKDQTQVFKEYILPYSVQYNESFHNFLVRIANRNGEFLYWENGILRVGLPSLSKKPVQITKYESRSYENDLFDVDANTKPVHALITSHQTQKEDDPTVEMDKDLEFGENAMLYNSEVSNESYWATLHKDNYDTQADLWAEDFPMPFLLYTATGYLNETCLMDIVLGLAEEMATTAIENALKASKIKSKYEKLFNSGQEDNYDPTKEYYSQFSSYVKDVKSVGKEFYHTIHLKENHMDQSKMQISCVGTFYQIRLGDSFYVDDKTETFVPIVIEGSVKMKDDKTYTDQLSYTAIPVNNSDCYPIHSEQGWIRTSGPQTAYVMKTGDPFQLGRIRIRYLWTAAKDGSPWIRVSLPKASSESGIFFLPEEGDEILVNYENGNVERPYMVGGLHNSRTAPNDGGTNQTITSVNGHQIAFKDGSASDFLAGVSPAFSTFSKFIPGFKDATKFGSEGDGAKLSGGITLCDPWGFYSISMSTNKRAIAIDCPLGKVGINAFTGISISAPNGNVKIEGKNVTISAGNKLTIQSGNNIQDLEKKKGFLSMVGEALLDKGKDMLKSYLCDLSLIRTILEVFLKPIDGTMRIGSKRYLCIQAGAGEAKILNKQYLKSISSAQIRAMMKPGGYQNGALLVRNIDSFICTLVSTMTEKYNTALRQMAAYKAVQQKLTDTNFPKGDWKADLNSMLAQAKKEEPELPELDLKYYKNLGTNQPLVPLKDLNKTREAFLEAAQAAVVENTVKKLQEECVVDDEYYELMEGCDSYKNCLKAIDLLQVPIDDLIKKAGDWKLNPLALLKIRRETMDAVLPAILEKVKMERTKTIQGKNFQSDWEAMVKDIQYKDAAWAEMRGEPSKLGAFLAEVTGFKGFADQYAWDQADRGEILFSNDEQTLHYNGQNIEPFSKERPMPLDEIKQALRDITI
ncbi:MAG: phage baseplate assembly protein V [Parabacteroides sp.]|nr:phage baseplate assembly protein V [Parabacteroides sp.]